MRSIVTSSVVSTLAFVGAMASLAGCNNTEPPRLYATMAWKMRCPNPADLPTGCRAGCTEGMDRLFNGFTGEEGRLATCTVTELATQRIINLQLRSSGYGVQFTNVVLPRAETPVVASSGTVRLSEGANDFFGAAGGSTPTTEQPCQITDVRFFIDTDSGDPTFEGEVLCQTMRSDADMQLCRGLSIPGGGGGSTPAQFTVYGCSGLSL